MPPTSRRSGDGLPLVSVVLATRDRPRLLSMAFAGYRHQTYERRELIIVDDGEAYPVDEQVVSAAGGRLVRVPHGTPLGTKLNEGVAVARGSLCQKMDDDDWYAPGFLEAMVQGRLAAQRDLCRPVLAFLSPFLFFDLARWEVRRSIDNNAPGATLQFARDDWEQHPFRAVRGDEDVWFLIDHLRAGGDLLRVRAPESYLAVRHRGSASDRGHTWTHQGDGQLLEDYVRDRPLYERGVEALLPTWALDTYRELRAEMLGPVAQPAADPLDGSQALQVGPAARVALERAPPQDDPAARCEAQQAPALPDPDQAPRILVLTPVKDAADEIAAYCTRLASVSYPHHRISVGLLESDSRDATYAAVERELPALRDWFRRVSLWKRDFGYHLPQGIHRGAEPIQVERRTVLAKSRNHLLFRALDDEDWVLWLDVDVVSYPPDLIERLLATGKEIVQPHCVLERGRATFDTNGWRDHGRLHLDDLRGEGELVELDAVGGTVLLVRADLHRDGLIFPSAPYGLRSPLARPGRGELETEGLGILARDMGVQAYGLPGLEVVHRGERVGTRPAS